MTNRAWSHNGGTQGPTGMALAAQHVANKIQTTGFEYDANGNMVRLVASGGSSATSWDARNRMTAFYSGPEDATRKPKEHYVYDASGYRIIRVPVNEFGDGNPRLYLRDGSGQLLSQYIERPADGAPVLQKDFVYGVGQLLAERTVTEEIPEFSSDAAFFGAQGYCFNVQSNVGFDTYFVDIRTPSQYLNQITGVVPDATGKFCLAESQFALDETNYIRVRGESEEAQPYSRAVTLAIDSTVTPESVNQVRAVSVSKPADNTIVRFARLGENGAQTYLHFNRADGGGSILLTPQGIAPGVTEQVFEVLSEAMLSPLGGCHRYAYFPPMQDVNFPPS